ncbi:MAG: hypothetical protein DRP81_06565, partial [Candidatus Omnitrophota bacterium]
KGLSDFIDRLKELKRNPKGYIRDIGEIALKEIKEVIKRKKEKKNALVALKDKDFPEFEIDKRKCQQVIFLSKIIRESVDDIEYILRRYTDDTLSEFEPDEKIIACLSIAEALAEQGFNIQARRLLFNALRLMSYGQHYVSTLNRLFELAKRINTPTEKQYMLNLVLEMYRKDMWRKNDLLPIVVPFAVSLGGEYNMSQIAEMFGNAEVYHTLRELYQSKKENKKEETKREEKIEKVAEEKGDISNLSAKAVSLAATGNTEKAEKLFKEMLETIIGLDKEEIFLKSTNLNILLREAARAGKWMEVGCIEDIIREALKVEGEIKRIVCDGDNTRGFSLVHAEYVRYLWNRGEPIRKVIEEVRRIEDIHVRAHLYAEILTGYLRNMVRVSTKGETKGLPSLSTGNILEASSISSSITFPSGKGGGYDFYSGWSVLSSMLHRGERIPVLLEMFRLLGEKLSKTDIIGAVIFLDRELKELEDSKKFKRVRRWIGDIIKGKKISAERGLIVREKAGDIIEAEGTKREEESLSLKDKIRQVEDSIRALGILLTENEIAEIKVSLRSRELLKEGNSLLGPTEYISDTNSPYSDRITSTEKSIKEVSRDGGGETIDYSKLNEWEEKLTARLDEVIKAISRAKKKELPTIYQITKKEIKRYGSFPEFTPISLMETGNIMPYLCFHSVVLRLLEEGYLVQAIDSISEMLKSPSWDIRSLGLSLSIRVVSEVNKEDFRKKIIAELERLRKDSKSYIRDISSIALQEVKKVANGLKEKSLVVLEDKDLPEPEIDEEVFKRIIFVAKIIKESINDLDWIFMRHGIESDPSFMCKCEPNKKIEACISIAETLSEQGFTMQARRLIFKALRLMSYGDRSSLPTLDRLLRVSKEVNTQVEKQYLLNLVLEMYSKSTTEELLHIILPFAFSLGKEFGISRLIQVFDRLEVYRALSKSKEKKKKVEGPSTKSEEKKGIPYLCKQANLLAAAGKKEEADGLFRKILGAILSENNILGRCMNLEILLDGVVNAGKWMEVSCMEEVINEAKKAEIEFSKLGRGNKYPTGAVSFIQAEYIRYLINRGYPGEVIREEIKKIKDVHQRARIDAEVLDKYLKDIRLEANTNLPALPSGSIEEKSLSLISFSSSKGEDTNFDNSGWTVLSSMQYEGKRIPILLEMLRLFTKGKELPAKTDIINTVRCLDKELNKLLKELEESKKLRARLSSRIKGTFGKPGLVLWSENKAINKMSGIHRKEVGSSPLEEKIKQIKDLIESLGILLTENEIAEIKVSLRSRELLKEGNSLLGPTEYISNTDETKSDTGLKKFEEPNDGGKAAVSVIKEKKEYSDKLFTILIKEIVRDTCDGGERESNSKLQVALDVLKLNEAMSDTGRLFRKKEVLLFLNKIMNGEGLNIHDRRFVENIKEAAAKEIANILGK